MATFSVIQAGTSLQMVDEVGNLTTLTLPTGITLRPDVPPRWVTFGRYVVLVNTPSQPLTIDSTGTVRLLSPKAPRLGPVLSGVGSSTLTGTYVSRYTFVTLDAVGNIISESDYSPISNTATITNQFLQAASLDISPDQISGRRLYRSTTGGTTLFQWVDLDGNILTSIQDNLSDAGLSLVASPVLGTPPHLTHIAEFRGRLWGIGDEDVDTLRYTETGLMYSWPADNSFQIPQVGSDATGVRALVQRREALGCGRSNQLVQITGSGEENADGTIDFDVVILSKNLGIESQETVSVFRDTAYFLWKDGVYSWDSSGITCISNGTPSGTGNVRTWFTTDNYFDRGAFPSAFGKVDLVRGKYRLFVLNPDGELNWVEYDIEDKTWWGPHKTGLFVPSSVFTLSNARNTEFELIGSTAGDLYMEQLTRTDGASTAIDFDVVGKRHDLGESDQEKFFGHISMWGKKQTTGTLAVLSRVGELSRTTEKIQSYDMTLSRQKLGRIGTGKYAQIEFSNAVAGDDVELYGIDVDPVNIIGRR